jgi:hypothetical protein
MSLMIVMVNSEDDFCLKRLGTNALEHAFGWARVRCRDVNTMKAMISAFSGDFLSFPVQQILQLASFPHRRASVGVDCHPLDKNEPSIFALPPRDIAIALLCRSGIPIATPVR